MAGRTTKVIEPEKKPFGDPYVLALAVIRGQDLQAIHRICKSETKVGRGQDVDFVLSDSLVSHEHIQIRVNGSLCNLVDLGSTNGTWVNGQKVAPGAPVRIKNFDEIRVGNTRILFIANRYHTDTLS